MGPNFRETVQWNQTRIVGLEKDQIKQDRENAGEVSKAKKIMLIIVSSVLLAILIGAC